MSTPLEKVVAQAALNILRRLDQLITDSQLNRSEMTAISSVIGKQSRQMLDADEMTANFVGQSVVLVPPTPAAFGSQNFSAIINHGAANPSSPRIVTVNLGLEFPDNVAGVPAGTSVLPQARITWGCGGAKHVVIVDVLKGSQITIACNNIIVEGLYTALSSGTLNNVRIHASLSYGNRGGSSTAPSCTLPPQTATAPAMGVTIPAVFTIPNFAKNVTIFTQDQSAADDPPGDIQVDFGTCDDTATAGEGAYMQKQATAPNTVPNQTYPIPGFARTIRVFNLGGTDLTVIPVFGLAL